MLDILESRQGTPGLKPYWTKAGQLALKQSQLGVAAVCFGAAGNTAKAAYLREVCVHIRHHYTCCCHWCTGECEPSALSCAICTFHLVIRRPVEPLTATCIVTVL